MVKEESDAPAPEDLVFGNQTELSTPRKYEICMKPVSGAGLQELWFQVLRSMPVSWSVRIYLWAPNSKNCIELVGRNMSRPTAGPRESVFVRVVQRLSLRALTIIDNHQLRPAFGNGA